MGGRGGGGNQPSQRAGRGEDIKRNMYYNFEDTFMVSYCYNFPRILLCLVKMLFSYPPNSKGLTSHLPIVHFGEKKSFFYLRVLYLKKLLSSPFPNRQQPAPGDAERHLLQPLPQFRLRLRQPARAQGQQRQPTQLLRLHAPPVGRGRGRRPGGTVSRRGVADERGQQGGHNDQEGTPADGERSIVMP